MFVLKKTSKTLVLLELTLLLSGPPALALTGTIPYSLRWFPAAGVILLAFMRIVSDRWTLEDWGIRPIHALIPVRDHLVITALAALGLLVFAPILSTSTPPTHISIAVIFFSFFVSFLQELIFRVFLISGLERMQYSKWAIVLISSSTFAFIHTFFEANRWFFIATCFIYGLAMALLYLRHRNLILLTLSHFVVNYMTVAIGLY